MFQKYRLVRDRKKFWARLNSNRFNTGNRSQMYCKVINSTRFIAQKEGQNNAFMSPVKNVFSENTCNQRSARHTPRVPHESKEISDVFDQHGHI